VEIVGITARRVNMETMEVMEQDRTWRDVETVGSRGKAVNMETIGGMEQGSTWGAMEIVEITE
jgi:hypothetical protein